MNKIKISEEQGRVRVEFDFENIDVARQYFNDEGCIKDLVEALGDEENNEEPKEETNPEIEKIKDNLRELFSTSSTSTLNIFQRMVDEELGKRE